MSVAGLGYTIGRVGVPICSIPEWFRQYTKPSYALIFPYPHRLFPTPAMFPVQLSVVAVLDRISRTCSGVSFGLACNHVARIPAVSYTHLPLSLSSRIISSFKLSLLPKYLITSVKYCTNVHNFLIGFPFTVNEINKWRMQ